MRPLVMINDQSCFSFVYFKNLDNLPVSKLTISQMLKPVFKLLNFTTSAILGQECHYLLGLGTEVGNSVGPTRGQKKGLCARLSCTAEQTETLQSIMFYKEVVVLGGRWVTGTMQPVTPRDQQEFPFLSLSALL